jgi:hypothetical protein
MAKKKKAKSSSATKPSVKKKSAVRQKTIPPKKVAKRVPAKSASKEPSLGRPKVTGEELLFMLFKEDYAARKIFDFLRVERVKDLEQYSPQQIVRLLSRPITETVDRIRRKLAEKNRSLRDDAEFASEYQSNE